MDYVVWPENDLCFPGSGGALGGMDAGSGMLRRVADSGDFADWERSFARATGRPVRLVDAEGGVEAFVPGRKGSGVCGLLAAAEGGCELCADARARIGGRAKPSAGAPEMLQSTCPAGLSEALVPVSVGGRVLGFLQTGQVLLRPPSEAGFRRLCRWLERRGVRADLERLRAAYFSSQVVERAEYRAQLAVFKLGAEALASRARAAAARCARELSPPVRRACDYLKENAQDPVSLADVSRAAGLSRHHFCAVFRKETGRTFTEHLTLIRIERAAERLREPGARVSEVAHGVGFQSLSQFNRSFRKLMGSAPSEWRRER